MKSSFASSVVVAALLGVSVFAEPVVIEGPALVHKDGYTIANMSLVTNWVRNRKTNIDGEEFLAIHVTSKLDMPEGSQLKDGDEVQMYHCGQFRGESYCTTHQLKLRDTTYWNTEELMTFQHIHDYTDLRSLLTQYVTKVPTVPGPLAEQKPSSFFASIDGAEQLTEYLVGEYDDGRQTEIQ